MFNKKIDLVFYNLDDLLSFVEIYGVPWKTKMKIVLHLEYYHDSERFTVSILSVIYTDFRDFHRFFKKNYEIFFDKYNSDLLFILSFNLNLILLEEYYKENLFLFDYYEKSYKSYLSKKSKISKKFSYYIFHIKNYFQDFWQRIKLWFL